MTSKLSLAGLLVSVVLASATAVAAPQTGCGNDVRGDGASVAAPRTTPSMASIAACTKIASPAKRLDCYDALTGHSD